MPDASRYREASKEIWTTMRHTTLTSACRAEPTAAQAELTPLTWPKLLLLVLAGAFAMATHAMANPTINNNFVANVSINADRSTAVQLLDQSSSVSLATGAETFKIYSWYSGHKVQYNFTHPAQIIQEAPYPASTGLFDFLQQAMTAGTCDSNGRSGVLWTFDPAAGDVTTIDLCANGNTPIDITWFLGADDSVRLNFNSFSPGVPAPSNFIPEPSSLSLAAFALICGAMARRRRSRGG